MTKEMLQKKALNLVAFIPIISPLFSTNIHLQYGKLCYFRVEFSVIEKIKKSRIVNNDLVYNVLVKHNWAALLRFYWGGGGIPGGGIPGLNPGGGIPGGGIPGLKPGGAIPGGGMPGLKPGGGIPGGGIPGGGRTITGAPLI